MKTVKLITCGVAAALAMVGTSSADLSFSLNSSSGVFINPHPTVLPADSWYQLWWSADATTIMSLNSGDIQVDTATFTSLNAVDPGGSGDYLLMQGGTPGVAGFPGNTVTGQAGNSDVGGADIHSGFIYAILYYDGSPAKSSTDGLATAPTIGASALYSEIQDTSAMQSYTPPGAVPPASNPVDQIDFAGGPVIDDGSHFEVIDNVPEPGTMALFALGVATIAWRRRKK
jgi:hypothetical protein